ncbi:carboxymuconolactone decarboxylase family protein [Rhodococcus rhodnii]|uniref:Carboxymuconolactone decarboxylase family protein n=1 Tax=Rhodococcus rhodnii TaxID=38312 RepID=A0A6P2CJG1_9NOCA|nr:carboxymuconolactone decarboxylase family protein [Rhodococcus rhodnii]
MSEAHQPRVRPGRFAELGPVNWVLWRILSFGAGVPDAHLFSTLGRTRGLFRGWLHLSARLMPFGRLPRLDTELVILRVAHVRSCEYERRHHERLGRRAGVTRELARRVTDGPDAPGWSDRHRALLHATDALVTRRTLTDDEWAALADHLPPREAVEFCLLVTQYDGLATTITALRIAPDRDE